MIDEAGGFDYLVTGLVVGVPILAGLGAIAAGVLRWRRISRLNRAGQRVTALVADNQLVSVGEGRVRFRPVVTFRTLDGREVKTVLEGASSYQSHLAETPIDVVYDPDDPQRAAVPGNRAGGPVAGVVVGLVFVAFGCLAYLLVTSA
jgi:hypothetical protein